MNILLVDDNVYILEGLKAGIDFQALGIGRVFEARNMQDAIKLMLEEDIPLVLTDIEMPHGTGLQLLEWINENRPCTVTVFCTSFADFDYAKKAVELHSFGYYLKPVLYEELYDLLKSAMDEVLNRRQAREKERYGEYWLDSVALRRRHFWEDALIKVYSFDEDELELLAQADHLSYSRFNCFSLVLLRFEKARSRMEGFSRKLERFVIENIVEELLENVPVSIETLMKCQKDTWIIVFSHPADEDKSRIRRVVFSVTQTIGRTVHCPVNGYFAYRTSFNDIRGRYRELEYLCQNHVSGDNRVFDLDDYPKQEDGGMAAEDVVKTENAVRKVKSYIDEHFCENIDTDTLEEIAYYSSDYLGKLFKQKNGISLGAYVIEKRMEMARKLLWDDRMRVSEVAQAVGYDNFAYFSRLFRKKTGMAPKEYRRSKRT